MRRVFYHVTVNILLAISDEMNMAQVMRKTGCVILTINRVINKFEKVGLITTKKIGRERKIYLTKKGKLIQGELGKI